MSEFRGQHGEMSEAFARGQTARVPIKAPNSKKVNEPGTDMIHFNRETKKVELVDNKAFKEGATVSEVSALERETFRRI